MSAKPIFPTFSLSRSFREQLPSRPLPASSSTFNPEIETLLGTPLTPSPISISDPVQRVVETGNFLEIDRLSPTDKIRHIPTIVARFGLTPPDPTIFTTPAQQWREIITQYSYKHLSEIVPPQSNLMTPPAYFIQAVRNGDLEAFNRIDVSTLKKETLNKAVSLIFAKKLDRSHYIMGLRLFDYTDTDERMKLMSFAAKLGDFATIDRIQAGFGRYIDPFEDLDLEETIFLIRNGRNERAIAKTESLLPVFQSDAEQMEFNVKNIYFRDGRSIIESGDPEHRAEVWFDRIKQTSWSNPVIANLMARFIDTVEPALNFYDQRATVVNPDVVEREISKFDFSALTPAERTAVDEFLTYFRMTLNALRKEVDYNQKHAFDNRLWILAQNAMRNDNVEYFRYILAQYKNLDDATAKSFLNYVSGDNEDKISIKPKILQFLRDKFNTARYQDALIDSQILVAIRQNDFDTFRQILEKEGYPYDPEPFVRPALTSRDPRFVEMFIQKYPGFIDFNTDVIISPEVYRFLLTTTEYRRDIAQFPIGMIAAWINDTNFNQFMDIFDDMNGGQGLNRKDLEDLMSHILLDGNYRYNEIIFPRLLALKNIQSLLTARKQPVRQLIYQYAAVPVRNSNIIRMLITAMPKPVQLDIEIFEAVSDQDGDRDLYIWMLNLVKLGQIQIDEYSLNRDRVSDLLFEHGFSEMSTLESRILTRSRL